MKPEVRAGDRLLVVLGGGRSSSLYLVTAFHTLWVPCVDGGASAARWEEHVASGAYRLVLATRAERIAWAQGRPGFRPLGQAGPVAFFATAP